MRGIEGRRRDRRAAAPCDEDDDSRCGRRCGHRDAPTAPRANRALTMGDGVERADKLRRRPEPVRRIARQRHAQDPHDRDRHIRTSPGQ